jgi:hypothetical protein
MAADEREDTPQSSAPVGPGWLPPHGSELPMPRWLNGRSLPAVWRDTVPLTIGGLLAAKDFPQMRLGAGWEPKPEPGSDQDVDQAIAAKLHLGLRTMSAIAEAQLVVVEPNEASPIPNWADIEEAAAYAARTKLLTSPMFLDFEGADGSAIGWEEESWPLPFHLRGAACWTAEGLLSIVPFGSVGGVHPWGGTDYQPWARWIFVQDNRPNWPEPGPGDCIARADGQVASWIDLDGESVCAQQAAVTFNLTQRVLRVLWAFETAGVTLTPPRLPRPERRRAKRAGQKIGLVPLGLPRWPDSDLEDDDNEDGIDLTEPCPVRNAHARLNQAHIFWHEALVAYNDPEAFVTKLNALIQSMRTVTWALQKDMGKASPIHSLYETWQDRMKADPRMVWLKNARNHIEKRGDLETHSKARVRVVGEMLHGGATDIDIEPDVPVDEIARRLALSGVGGRALHEGTLVVERRWTVDAMPDDELLDVLAHCFGVLLELLVDCHDALGTSMSACAESNNAGCSRSDGARNPTGRPACMWAGREARTVRRNLSSGAPVRASITSVVGPALDIEEIRERYSFSSVEPIPEEADVFDKARNLHEQGRQMLLVDQGHVMIAWLFRDGKALGQNLLEPKDQREKYLMMDVIASEATKLGANELILSAEAWEAAPVDANDPRAELRAAEREDRRESFLTHVAQRNGRSLTLRSIITRGPEGVELAAAEELAEATPPLVRPLLEAWAEWPS